MKKDTYAAIQSLVSQLDINRIGAEAVVHQANDPLLLFNRIVAQALVLVPSAEGASVELVHRDELVYASCSGTLAPHVGLRLSISGSFSGLSVCSGQILRCDDSETDPRVDRQACRIVGAVSMLCVPLRGSTKSVGVLKIASKQPYAFDDDDVAVLEALVPFLSTTVAAASELASIMSRLTMQPKSDINDGQRSIQSTLSASQADAVNRFATNVMRPGLIDTIEARQSVLSALAPDAITMHAQPIYCLSDGRLWGVEALARFQLAPVRPPDQWFNEAHRVGLGVELELAAVRKALALLEEVPTGVHLAINVGPATLSTPYLKELFEDVDPGTVVLELTEHATIDNYETLSRNLVRYRRRGIKLAVDDAGAGVSGLAHILRLAPDYIKLDCELTRGIEVDPVRRSLTAALVHFADESGAEVIAEGIENPEALAVLTSLKVGYGQGYYLGRPSPISQIDPASVLDLPLSGRTKKL